MPNTITKCSECGREVNLNWYGLKKPITKAMTTEQLCFDCAYWKRYLEHPMPGALVISGAVWFLTPVWGKVSGRFMRKPNMAFLHDLATGQRGCCTERHKVADISEHFKPLIPDQHRFISKDTYLRMANWKGVRCQAKGCWDRYCCYWYDKTMEKGKAWNRLPLNYKPGMEQCESFINTKTMYNVNY